LAADDVGRGVPFDLAMDASKLVGEAASLHEPKVRRGHERRAALVDNDQESAISLPFRDATRVTGEGTGEHRRVVTDGRPSTKESSKHLASFPEDLSRPAW
jgi:hypothetical protein